MINVLLEKFFGRLPDWLSVLIVSGLSLLVLLLAVLLAFLLIRAVLRIKWKSQTIRRFIRVCNQGNVTGKFLLRVEGPREELRIQCLLDGSALPAAPAAAKMISVQTSQAVQPARASHTAPPSLAVAAGRPQSDGQDPASDEAKKKLADSAAKAKEKSKKGLGFVRLFSGIFGSLGGLLPGSVGASFKEKSADLQKASQDASAKMQMPEQKLKSVEHLKGQVNQLKPGDKEEKPAPAPAVTTPAAPRSPAVSGNSMEPVGKADASAPRALEARQARHSGFLQTPPLSPGESLCLELRIDPLHTYRSGEYSFAVWAHQEASPATPSREALPDLTSRGSVVITGLSPIYWLLSFLMALCAVVLNGTWAVLFVSWLAGLAL